MDKFDHLLDKARPYYNNGDPGHDIAHILRVVVVCTELGKAENARLEILLPAAVLHDVVNIPKNHPDRSKASTMAAEKAQELLREADYSAQEITDICNVIAEHSYSAGRAPSTKESAILQDADRLDSLGAVGIMRTVSCGVAMGSTYYSPTEPIPGDEPIRSLDDKKFTVDHFFIKLFKLPATMNTKAARSEAEKRVKFMRNFLTQLESEISL